MRNLRYCSAGEHRFSIKSHCIPHHRGRLHRKMRCFVKTGGYGIIVGGVP